MTRATLYVILNTGNGQRIISSCEFNGDGYFDNGHGTTHIAALERIKSVTEFEDYINKFNALFFKYENGGKVYKERQGAFIKKTGNGIFIDLKKSKYKFVREDGKSVSHSVFSSDWQFFKNFTDKVIGLKTKDGQLYILKQGEQVALNYGRYEGHYCSLEHGKEVHNVKEVDLSEYNEIFNEQPVLV